jgi:hypothetical protein
MSNFFWYYNDQPPEMEEFKERAHSKGLMNFNDKQGFWLIHSGNHQKQQF